MTSLYFGHLEEVQTLLLVLDRGGDIVQNAYQCHNLRFIGERRIELFVSAALSLQILSADHAGT